MSELPRPIVNRINILLGAGPSGKRSIHNLCDLRERFHVDEVTGCWWPTRPGRQKLYVPMLNESANMGVVICALVTGKRPEPGVIWHRTCTTPYCGSPYHRVIGDRLSLARSPVRTDSPLRRARIVATRRAQSDLSDQAVQDIRDSDETLRVVAERHGICVSYASKIRRGESRVAPAQASVFAWRGAA